MGKESNNLQEIIEWLTIAATSLFIFSCSGPQSTESRSATNKQEASSGSFTLIDIEDQSIFDGEKIEIDVDATDGDSDESGNPLTYSCAYDSNKDCSDLLGEASFDSESGAFSWTTTAAAVGNTTTTYDFKITGSNDIDSSDVEFSVTVKSPLSLSSIADRTYQTGTVLIAGSSSVLIDMGNTVFNSDDSVIYNCAFDQIVDGQVAVGTDCLNLPGSTQFNANSGVLDWTPALTTDGLYEIKISATYDGIHSSSEVFVLLVQPPYVTDNLLINADAKYGNTVGLGGSGTTWQDLSESNDGTLSGGATWAGNGNSSPYHLDLDGSGRVNFGAAINGEDQFLFSGWFQPGSASSPADYLWEMAGSSVNFALVQSQIEPGKIGFTVGPSYSDVVMADNPVGYWRLNESSGNAEDETVNNNDGTYMNGPTLAQPGLLTADTNQSALFDGTFEYVSFTDNSVFRPTSAISVEAWFMTTNKAADSRVVSKTEASGYQLSLNEDVTCTVATLCWLLNVGGGYYEVSTPVTNIENNEVYHIVGTYDGSTMRMYLNGQLVGSNATPSGAIQQSASSNLCFGSEAANGSCSSSYFPGRIDEVAIYSTALSEEAIQRHFAAGRGAHTTDQLVDSNWYHLSAIYDSTNDKATLFLNGQTQSEIDVDVTYSDSNNFSVGSNTLGGNFYTGQISTIQLYSSGDGADAHTNFNALANRFRDTPGTVLEDNVVFHLDAANANLGMSANPDDSCANTTWFDLAAGAHNPTLTNFSGCGDSTGWNGDGSVADPFRLSLDGTNDFALIPTFSNPTTLGDLTVTVWAKLDTLNTRNYLIDFRGNGMHATDSIGLFIDNDTPDELTFYAEWSSGGWSEHRHDLSFVPTDGWHEYTMQREGSTMRVYVDGALVAGTTVNTAKADLINMTHGGRIGTYSNASPTGNYWVDGSIALVTVYDEALSASEILKNCKDVEARFTASADICD